MSEALSEEQRRRVQAFSDVTGEHSWQICGSVLAAHDWVVESAVAAYFDSRSGVSGIQRSALSGTSGGLSAPSTGTGAAPRSTRSPAVDASGAGSAAAEDVPGAAPSPPAERVQSRSPARGGGSMLWSLVATPLSWLSWGLWGTLSASLRVLFFPLRMITGPAESDPQHEAETFVASFRGRYGEAAPPFMECDYRTAASRARDQKRFLLVYLHSWKHADSETFCSNVLCTEGIAGFLRDNLLVWGGDITASDAYAMAQELEVTAFPFLALMVQGQGSNMSLVDRIEGLEQASNLLERLTAAMESAQSVLDARIAEETAREHERMLRMEQEVEYREAARRDAELAARRDAERREVEQRAREEEEAKRRAEEEEQATERERQEAAARLPPEPSAGPDAVRIRVNLPSGGRLERRFLASHPLRCVRDAVCLVDGAPRRFLLCSSFPRRTFKTEEESSTLQELGLTGMVALFVQDLEA